MFTYPGDKWVREGTLERRGCNDSPSASYCELQETNGRMQEIMRLGDLDNFNDGLTREHTDSLKSPSDLSQTVYN